MKIIKILFAFAILPFFSFAQSPQEIGTAFINDFFEQKFDAAADYFDESVKDQINIDVLKQTETALAQQLGAFKKTLEINIEEEAPYKTVFYYSEFEKAKLDVKIVFNDKNKIVGFFFAPHQEFDKKKAE